MIFLMKQTRNCFDYSVKKGVHSNVQNRINAKIRKEYSRNSIARIRHGYWIKWTNLCIVTNTTRYRRLMQKFRWKFKINLVDSWVNFEDKQLTICTFHTRFRIFALQYLQKIIIFLRPINVQRKTNCRRENRSFALKFFNS